MPKLEIRFEPGVIVHISGGKFPGQEEKDRYYLIISEYSTSKEKPKHFKNVKELIKDLEAD